MSNFTQWIIVDDTSADINYLERSWFSEVGWDSVGSYGMPYLGTLHGTSSNAGFVFDFTGSGVRVVGSISSNGSDYWTCSVDGANMVVKSAFETSAPRNNFVFCTANWLDDRRHTLTVSATPQGNQTFWFDRIEYVPSQQVSLEQKAIGVALGGPGLDSSAITTFVFTFYGLSVSWYGTIFDSNSGNLSWSMDNADAHIISNWNGLSASNVSYPLAGQKFFESQNPIGLHTLKVSYIANKATTPLGFDYLVVQNGTVPSRSTSESSSPQSTASSSGTSAPVARGTIAGGITGGVLLIGIAVLGFYFFRRRLKSKKVEAYSDVPIPFNQPKRQAYLGPQTHPVQRKSQMVPSHSQSVANLPLSDRSRINQTNLMNEPPTFVSSGLNAHYIGDHGRRTQPIPSSEQEVVAVDIGQDGSLFPGPSRMVVHKDSGIRFNGETL